MFHMHESRFAWAVLPIWAAPAPAYPHFHAWGQAGRAKVPSITSGKLGILKLFEPLLIREQVKEICGQRLEKTAAVNNCTFFLKYLSTLIPVLETVNHFYIG